MNLYEVKINQLECKLEMQEKKLSRIEELAKEYGSASWDVKDFYNKLFKILEEK